MEMPRKHENTKDHEKQLSGRTTFVLFCAFVFLWQIQYTAAQTGQRDAFPQPYRVVIDTAHNAVSWRAPGNVLLAENFNDYSFPPAGWTASSNGKGWMRSGSVPFLTWTVPENISAYVLANDDSASVQNDGSLDMLISPVVNLTTVDSCRLNFSSFFTGAYGQAATIKYRLNSFGEWTELFTPEANLAWQPNTFDLSGFSGPEGEIYFQMAFHADDRGCHASGWAIDDVEIFGKVLSMNPLDYLLFWDGIKLDSTTAYSFSLPFSYYGENHQFGICARYSEGNSDTVFIDFESRNLPPPQNLEIDNIWDDYIDIQWNRPYHPPYCDPYELQFDFETETSGIQGGCESDGEYIYISYQYAPKFDKYDLAGNFIETFTITGIPGILDMAWGYYYGYMFGGHGGNTIYVMDFNSKTLVDQITAPCTVRGLAFDPNEELFYANNLSSNIFLFEYDGDTLFSIPVGDIGNYYGLAMDWNDGYLWGFSRDSTGALMVQYDIAERQRTGLTIDVSYLAENGGQACGLYVNNDIIENCATIGGNLWNDVAFGFSLQEQLPWGWDPPGVDHYRLYNQDTIIYIDENLFNMYYYNQPGYEEKSYKFEVSAWYDLADFGYPGEYKESAKDGPVYLNGPIPPQTGLELDFIERWQSESFTENSWDTTGEGWFVHPNFGNPYPTAVFRGMVNPDNYDGMLTSSWFNVKKGDSCEVMLIFDLKILDYFPTGLQTMALEAFDAKDITWKEVKVYHNDTIMLNFITDSLLLSPYIFNNQLRFRFHTYGIDASDVGYWMMDNIRVEYACLPPYDLQAELTEGQDSVLVSWKHHYSGMEQWIQHDDGVKFTEAGFGSGPENWYDIATRWESGSIHDLDNYRITWLDFIPTMTEASYILKIWSGEEAGNPVYEKIITDYIPGEWNSIEVDPPVPVDVLNDLWIGYSCSSRGGNPFAMDQGPAVDGYGNLIRINSEWTTMLSVNPALDYNFNIRAQLERPPGHVEAFQVYQRVGSGPFQHIATTDSSFVLLPLASLTEEQCFRSRIVCFNEPGMIVVSGFSEEACVLPVFTVEQSLEDDDIRIYPNPTGGVLHIESVLEIERVELYDINGKLMDSSGKSGSNFNLNLETVNPGIYMIRLYTSSGFESRRIVILP